MSSNTVHQSFKIRKTDREHLHSHNSYLIWFTGLSGSGKSTLANLVEIALHKKGFSTYTLDGDNIRQGINKNLSFTPKDRSENIRRIAEIANLMIDAGILTLASFISPYIVDRERVRQIVGVDNFIEIYVNTSLEECEKRDVKGLYKKVRDGEIKNFTGIDSPYDIPKNPNLIIDTSVYNVDDCVDMIVNKINYALKIK